MSEECGCDCGTESWDTGLIVGGQQDEVRGSNQGDFNGTRPNSCLVHNDWCSHRPTKAFIVTSANGNANGTARVFVEATADLSKYVFAEIQVQAGVQLPTVDLKKHFSNGSTSALASYTPVFGTATGSFAFSARNVSDGDTYLKSLLPTIDFPSIFVGSTSQAVVREATRLTVRCGHRQNGADTIVASFASPFWSGALDLPPGYGPAFVRFHVVGIGCCWEDIEFPNDTNTVRCGFERVAGGDGVYNADPTTAQQHGFFTFPFEVPRDLFISTTGGVSPNPAQKERYVGVSATESIVQAIHRVTANGPGSPEDSRRLIVDSVTTRVACGANHANVIIDPDKQDLDAVPPVAMRGTAQVPTVNSSAPLFVRRPDVIAKGAHAVANADSWHATHLVHRGASLAQRNAVHNLEIDFVAASRAWTPARSTVIEPRMPQQVDEHGWGVFWGGVSNVMSPGRIRRWLLESVSNEEGPQFSIQPISDAVIYGFAYGQDAAAPPLWFWSLISGSHTLTPFVDGRRLMPNSWHAFSGQAHLSREVSIATPAINKLAGDYSIRPVLSADQQGLSAVVWQREGWAGPFSDQEWTFLQSVNAPFFKDDYRVAYKIESFPQIWATTTAMHGSQAEAGISYSNQIPSLAFADSGMTTEAYDAYDAYSQQGAAWATLNSKSDAILNIYMRLGVKITVQKIKGFRAKRTKGEEYFTIGGVAYFKYDTTGEVEEACTHSSGDVACTEFYWGAGPSANNNPLQLNITWQDRQSLGSGSQIEKQLPVGVVQQTGEQISRTVRLRLSAA